MKPELYSEDCSRILFRDIYIPGSDTKYNFQSGAKDNVSGMAMYACSANQFIFNSYLKEEIYYTLKHVPKIRVIVDEIDFVNEKDELLKFLMQSKRQGKVELVMVSRNIKDALHGNIELDFQNVVMFLHGTSAATDDLSTDLFGSYKYYFPVPVAGNTPHVFFSIERTVNWQIQSEERPRVRSQDLYAKLSFWGRSSTYLAVKTTANANIYLIPITDFLPAVTGVPVIV